MRLGTQLTCPTCGEAARAAVDCLRCRVPVVDESGQTPPVLESRVLEVPPSGPSLGRMVARASYLPAGLAVLALMGQGEVEAMAMVAALLVFVLLLGVQWVVDRLRRGAALVAHAAARAEARARVAKLRDAYPLRAVEALVDDSPVRVRGRVKVLEPVTRRRLPREDDRPVAAELYDGPWRSLGRFLVVDEAGREVLVDDDAIEMWSEAAPGGPVAVAEGDAVEIAGVGRHHHVGQHTEGYRGTSERRRYQFEGRADRPIHLISVA